MRQNIFKDFMVLGSSRVVNVLLTMIQAMLFVRSYSLYDYGLYSQVVLITGIATIVFSISVENSLNYFLSSSSESKEKKHIISQVFMLAIFQGIICSLILMVFKSSIINYFQNDKLEQVFIIVAILPFFTIFKSIFEVTFIALNKTRFASLGILIITVTQLAISILTYIFKYSIELYLILLLFMNLIFITFIFISVKKEIGGFEWKIIDKDLITRILSYAVPLWFAGISAKLNVELDKLFIGRYLGTKDLAIYANMARELPIAVITGSLTTILLPKMIAMYKRKSINNMLNMWKSGIELSWIIVCTSVTFLLVMSSEVLIFLYSEKYIEGLPVFRIYIIVLLLRVAYFGIILNVTNNTKYIFRYTIAALGLNVLMNYVFFYYFGLIGPALGTLVSNLVVGFLQLVHSSKIIDCRFRFILPWGKMTKIFIFYSIIAVPLYIINLYLINIGLGYMYRILLIGLLICGLTFFVFWKRVKVIRKYLIIEQ